MTLNLGPDPRSPIPHPPRPMTHGPPTPHWNRDPEPRSLVGRGLVPYLAAHAPSQSAGEGESAAGAFGAAGSRLFDLPAGLEDALDLGRGDADAGIPDVEVRGRVIVTKANADGSLRSEFDRVGKQIEQDLLELGGIRADLE